MATNTMGVEVRGGQPSKAEYGSDLVIEMLRLLDVPYVALNPGSSFRGIHDSLVNFPPSTLRGPQGGAGSGQAAGPEMVLCCHEEIAVAVALGYARASGKPMAAATHSMVGLQHASMAIYNAWCERQPMIVIGGTGPMATDKRRNWIDWVHTALVQGNQVRDYTKWDDQPASTGDFPASLVRGHRIAMTEPYGPVYLCYDVGLQEEPVTGPITLPDVSRFRPPAPVGADPDALREAAALLAGAQWPVIVADAVGRHKEALPVLAQLAETLAAPVVSVGGYNMASNHALNFSPMRQDMLARADVVLALDIADMSGALGTGVLAEYDPTMFVNPQAKVIHISVWDLLQHSWASDYERLEAVDLPITGATRVVLPELVDLCRQAINRDVASAGRIADRRKALEGLQASLREQQAANARRGWDNRPISGNRLFGELWSLVKDQPWTFVNGAPGGRGGFETTQAEQVVSPGGASGAGVGSGAGSAIGATLALKDTGRLFISVQGDGDLLYTPSSLYTTSNMKLPLLTIVNNNRSYGNDEGHQEHMARTRGRPIENKGVGIFIEDPSPDFAKIASGFDIEAFGAVHDPNALHDVLDRALQIVIKEQRPVLVDVVTERPRRW
ncbi:MAG TPA: thiamine pyrophosphate-dependent enzyme [Dehalococcoidia bacterium]|nr:thiamine pyrophosphate-dependent enzyme [Dehalococcoidia bacterium]